jgi:hypothetical protein
MRPRTLLAFTLALAGPLAAAELEIKVNGDTVRMAASGLRILEGRSLERLRNGVPVVIHLNLTVSAGHRGNAVYRNNERATISYDLWEETYAVAFPRPAGASAAHKTTAGAEAWLLGQIAVRKAALPSARDLYFRLDVRVEDPEAAEPGTGLRGLVEVLSRPRARAEQRWTLERGPVKLASP